MFRPLNPLTPTEAGIRVVPLPTGAARGWIANVLVGKHIQNCVAFLGMRNGRGDFVPYGTAFFVGLSIYQHTFPYVVTAKHVVDMIPGDELLLRVNTRVGSFRFITLNRSSVFLHPSHDDKRHYIDVAVFRLEVDYTDLDLTLITRADFANDEHIAEYDIGTGDEVAVTGLFHSHEGRIKNMPLVRIGNIAAMPDEPLPTDMGWMDGYLIESRSIGGLSGSPVFTHLAVRPERTLIPREPYPNLESKILKKPPYAHYLLGMIQGYYSINMQQEWVLKTTQQAGDMNTGISIVTPIAKIAETIDQDTLSGADAKRGKELLDEVKRNSGARSASASRGDPPSNDEANPNHREDFTSLLSAAAKTKPQDDRT